MADVKTSALPEAVSMAATDNFLIVADIGTVPITKRIPQTTAIPFTTTPTANKIPQADALGKIDQNWITDYKPLWISGWQPTKTSGCGQKFQVESSVNKNVYDVLPFDSVATELAFANVPMPYDYDGGTVTAEVYWMCQGSPTAYKVAWGIFAGAMDDNESIDIAMGTAQPMDDEADAVDELRISPESSALTINGTPAAGKLIQFKLYRYPDSANDTLDVDALLVGVLIKYGVQ